MTEAEQNEAKEIRALVAAFESVAESLKRIALLQEATAWAAMGQHQTAKNRIAEAETL